MVYTHHVRYFISIITVFLKEKLFIQDTQIYISLNFFIMFFFILKVQNSI